MLDKNKSIIFTDEFDTYNTTTDLSTQFTNYSQYGLDGNGNQDCNASALNTWNSENIYLGLNDNGDPDFLIIEAIELNNPVPCGSRSKFYSSAGINYIGQDFFTDPIDVCLEQDGFRDGLFEIRARVPDVQGFRPAF